MSYILYYINCWNVKLNEKNVTSLNGQLEILQKSQKMLKISEKKHPQRKKMNWTENKQKSF